MRKMYFAMIPKRGFLESAAIAAGVGVGLYLGAKKLLGEEQFDRYKEQLKNKFFDSGAKDFDATTAETQAQDAFADEDAAQVKQEADIMERVRKAAAKGMEKIL